MGKLLRSQFTRIFQSFLLCLVCSHAFADVRGLEDINWHGFLSQSFILTDENEFLGTSSDGSFKYNSAGLNASWKPTNRVQLSLQGLYKQIGNAEPKGVQLDYAIADISLVDEFEYGGGVRIGRLKNPYGFFNETRDVAATRPSLLLAESIYIDYLQSLFHSMDSIGLYARNETSLGTVSFGSNFGKPILTDDIVRTLMGGVPVSGDIQSERASMSRLMFEEAGGIWRAAVSYVWFRGNYDAASSDLTNFGISDGKLDIKQLLLSAEYNWNDFQFITEIHRRNLSNRKAFNFPVPFNIFDQALGYYFQVGYRVNNRLKAYLRYDEAYYDKDDKDGANYVATGRGNDHTAFAKDVTIGLSYTPSFRWHFGLEMHAVNGTFWLPNLENPDVPNQEQHWNMFLAQVAYRF
jgi:hypothetical protein